MRLVGVLVLVFFLFGIGTGLAGDNNSIQISKKQFETLKLSVAAAFQCLGGYYEKKQDLLPALNAYLKSLSMYKAANAGQIDLGYVYFRISSIFKLVNKTGLARKYLHKAMDTAVKYRDCQLKLMVFNEYSKLYQDEGDDKRALQYIERSLKTAPKCGPTMWLMETHYQEHLVLKRLGKKRDALRALERAVEEGITQKSYDNLLPILVELGNLRAEEGDLGGAREILEKIDDIYAPFYRCRPKAR